MRKQPDDMKPWKWVLNGLFFIGVGLTWFGPGLLAVAFGGDLRGIVALGYGVIAILLGGFFVCDQLLKWRESRDKGESDERKTE